MTEAELIDIENRGWWLVDLTVLERGRLEEREATKRSRPMFLEWQALERCELLARDVAALVAMVRKMRGGGV